MALTKVPGSMFSSNTITSNNIAANTINTNNFVSGISLGSRALTLSYPTGTSATTAGGQTITLTGSGFQTGSSVLVNKTTSSVVSVTNATSMTFRTPALSAGRYIVYIVSPDGSVAIHAPGILYA